MLHLEYKITTYVEKIQINQSIRFSILDSHEQSSLTKMINQHGHRINIKSIFLLIPVFYIVYLYIVNLDSSYKQSWFDSVMLSMLFLHHLQTCSAGVCIDSVNLNREYKESLSSC